MRVKLMDEETLNYLQSLAGHLYDYVERGFPPNEALKKVAVDFDLTPEYIRVVGRAYNSGITNYYIHQERDLKKLAHFQVCDPESVIKSLFKPKTAEDKPVCSLDYLIPAKSLQLKELDYGPPAPKLNKERDSIYKLREAWGLYQKAANEVEDLRHKLTLFEIQYGKTLDDIAAYFKRADAIDPDIVIENSKPFGIKADTLLKQAGVEKNPNKEYNSNSEFSPTAPPYSYLFRAQFLAERYKALSEKHQVKKAELDEVSKAFDFLRPTPPVSRRNCFFFQNIFSKKKTTSNSLSK